MKQKRKIIKVGINVSFLRKSGTGIGQVSVNFLKKLIEKNWKSLERNIQYILYLEEDINWALPGNFKKRVFLPIWKRDDLIRKIWWEKYLLPRQVKKDGCDIFLSMYQCPTILKKIKHIMVVHDIIPRLFPEYLNNWRKKIYWSMTEKAIANAGKVVAVSIHTEKDLIRHLGISSADIFVNHIDIDEIYKKKVSEQKIERMMAKYDIKRGYVYAGGGMEVRKNVEGVIRAYKYLLEKNQKEYFLNHFPNLIVSGKLLPQLAPLITDAEKLVRELNLTAYVKLLDFVPQEDLPALYSGASVFVYPSFYEGFGLPILEAMNQSTPVVTARNSCLEEVGGDAVQYCHPDSISDIAGAVKNVLLNKEHKKELVRRGRERSEYFSWNKFTDKMLEYFSNN
ncbi:MAG: Glycosyl transferase group 1 [Candidatus Moranbacteria bacterium GW2011_GWF1_36_4]|nr:MAG: Glycosyl transferase group 1 [Candidatus Moranbacteria bacterium GW2011_GWF1_36_4]